MNDRFFKMLHKARKAKALRKQIAFISLENIWPKPDPEGPVPAALRRYRLERKRKNRAARHSRARNRR